MRLKLHFLFSAVLVLYAGYVKADTFNDGFATAKQQQLSVSSVGNFSTINGTNVDALGPNLYPQLCTGVSYCVDLGGTAGNAYGNLVSNTTFAAGTYDLSFYLTGSKRGTTNTVRVMFGSYDQLITFSSSDVDNILNQLVTVTTPGNLSFVLTSATSVEEGPILDSASVTSLASGTTITPEPSSLMLLGSGLVGVVTESVRRRRNSGSLAL